MLDNATLPNNLSQYRLWQLMSPAFPVGMFSWSAGMEYAVEVGWVTDKKQACLWLEQQLDYNLRNLDVPLMARFYFAWSANDNKTLIEWSEFLYAIREAKENVEEDLQLGKTMSRVLIELKMPEAVKWKDYTKLNYLLMYTLACAHWQIDLKQAIQAYLWSWAENQVSAAIKLVPLGHLAGQSILSELMPKFDEVVDKGMKLQDEEIGTSLPALAIASALHEQQYSRMFRS